MSLHPNEPDNLRRMGRPRQELSRLRANAIRKHARVRAEQIGSARLQAEINLRREMVAAFHEGASVRAIAEAASIVQSRVHAMLREEGAI